MYCSHFGLYRPPFNNTPDPAFYYRTPEHEEALATLLYATQERKGFVMITGEVGAGKTLTARMYLRQIEANAETAVITHTHLSAQQLLAAICTEFDLNPSPNASQLELTQLLQDYLLEQFARDRYVVVMIDEAQNLPVDSLEELRMLGNLEADDAKLLQVCLLGQPELRQRLAQPNMRQLKQRLFRQFHLDGLTREQTGEYIRHRVSVAGCADRELFTDDAISRIHEQTGGIPRLVNQLCDNALLTAYANSAQQVDSAIVSEALEKDEMAVGAPAQGYKATDDRIDAVYNQQNAGVSQVQSDQQTEQSASSKPARAASAGKPVDEVARQSSPFRQTTADEPARQHAAEKPAPQTAKSVAVGSSNTDGGASTGAEQHAGAGQAHPRRQLDPVQPAPLPRVGQSQQRAFRASALTSPREPEPVVVSPKPPSTSRQPQAHATKGATAAPAPASPETQPSESRPAQSSRSVASEARLTRAASQRVNEAITEFSTKVNQREAELSAFSEHLEDRLHATEQQLAQLANRAVDAETIERVKKDYAQQISELGQEFRVQSSELKQLGASIRRQARAEDEAHRAEFQALSKRVMAQAQQLQDLRKKLLVEHSNAKQTIETLAEQMASRLDLENLREEVKDDQLKAAQQSESLLKQIEQNNDDLLAEVERNHSAMQDLIEGLVKRYKTTRDRIESLASSKVDAEEFVRFRSAQQQESSKLLEMLECERSDIHQQFEQTVAYWKQTQESLEALAETAAEAQELEAVKDQHERDTSRLLANVTAQRRDLEALVDEVGHRCDELVSRVDALPDGIATLEDLDGVRKSYLDQIRKIASRIAGREAHFESARRLHEKHIRAVAGKAQQTARKVAELEERGRPKHVQLELTPDVGVKLADLVDDAQSCKTELIDEVTRTRQAITELQQAADSVEHATMNWRQRADHVRREAEAANEAWTNQSKEVREEAAQLRASAKMTSEVLAKMQACNKSIDTKLKSGQWHEELSRAENLAVRLEQANRAARNTHEQLTEAMNRCQSMVNRRLDDFKQQLAARLVEFQGEKDKIDQVIDRRRELLATIAQNATGMAEVLEASRRDSDISAPVRQDASRAGHVQRDQAGREVQDVRWPRFRTHKEGAVRAS
jgi:general secretion pathway protein A